MKGKIFLLEDDESIISLVKVSLELAEYEVGSFSTKAAFLSALDKKPDVALLDIMLPDGSGLDALKEVKKKSPETYCIMLSALSKEEDKVNGLNLGADDYISKPFSVLELTARVNAAMRRKKETSHLLVAGKIVMDTEKMLTLLDGKPITLNKKEFELLKYFMENGGKVLSRESILSAVWGYDIGETRTLDNHVARLRRLGINNLETVFGVGYRLCV